MSYRRDSEGRRAWQLWVNRHRDTLLRCSLPESIFSDETRWFRFVEHDGWDQESGWGVSMLSPDQASALQDFLTSEYGGGEYRHLLRLLDQSHRKPRPPGDADRGGRDDPR
jgi:hypothetical protein